MKTADLVIAIDAGQTAIKVQVDGHRTELPGLRTNVEIMPQLAEVANAILAERRPDRWVLAVGSTGLTDPRSGADTLAELCRGRGPGEVMLAHDSVTCYLGALGPDFGVVVAAGTGAVTLGVGPLGVARVDGWGNIIGDAGSGYWIGRAALDAALRDFDGRGEPTALTELARRSYPDLAQAYVQLQTSPHRVAEIAALAKDVTILAEHDLVAARICREAGTELAVSAIAAARRVGVGESDPPRVCLTGGVLRAPMVAAACQEALAARWPGFQPTPAIGDGLRGVTELPLLVTGHPLVAEVQVATTEV